MMDGAEAGAEREHSHLVLRVLELLRKASHDLQCDPNNNLRLTSASPTSPSAAVKALLELENESDSILSFDPNLSNLSHQLSSLKSLVESHCTRDDNRRRFGLRSFLRRRASLHQIARVAGSIEFELQAWINRESIERLVKSLDEFSLKANAHRQHRHDLESKKEVDDDDDEEVEKERELTWQLDQFADRVSQGFNHELQDLVLKSKVFSNLELILRDTKFSDSLREHAAFAIESLIRFNKNVFVGQVLMGPTIHALISVGTGSSLRVLCSLIRSIKSPLVDEIESTGEIAKIIKFLCAEEIEVQVIGFDCVLEIGYCGRKEAIEAMISGGLVRKLVELQRSELGGDLIDVTRCVEERGGENIGCEDEEEEEKDNVITLRENTTADVGPRRIDKRKNGSSRGRYLVAHPFASCVARFAVQLEVGEGLRMREKRAFKAEVLRRIRQETSLSDAEAATIAAEVLWGSSP